MSQPASQQKDKAYQISIARDVISVCAIGLLLVLVHDLGDPFRRGFFCDDETISYPHKPSTVSSGLCYALGSGINLILILALEYLSILEERKSAHNTETIQKFPVKIYLKRVYYKFLIWFFGAVSSELFTDISKITAGRLRPHFIDVCGPVIKTDGREVSLQEYCSVEANKHQYILDYRCAKENRRDARMSFMSGHSSYSAYSAIFAMLYIQSDMNVAKFGMFKHAIQVLLASAAFYTGLTRISDNKHHWQDVLVGFLQGTTVATLVSLRLRPSYIESQSKYIRRNGRISNSDLNTELNRVIGY